MSHFARIARNLLHELRGNSFTADDVADRLGADLAGATAVVTGANSGVGRETARVLARCGAHVVLACRSAERGAAALAEVAPEGCAGSAEVMELDLASQRSVRAFAAAADAKFPGGVRILVNNAGVMMLPEFSTTEDGVEATFGVNHLGHFLLTELLKPALRRAAPARVVNVSSVGHTFVPDRPDADALLPPRRAGYDGTAAYAWSKLCNVLHAAELQLQLGAAGVAAVAVHPGVVFTELHRYSLLARLLYSAPVRLTAGRLVFKSVPQGAATTVYCCLCDQAELACDLYWANAAPSDNVHPLVHSTELGGRLTAVSRELCGLSEGSGGSGGSAAGGAPDS